MEVNVFTVQYMQLRNCSSTDYKHFLCRNCTGIVSDAGRQSFYTLPTERWKSDGCQYFTFKHITLKYSQVQNMLNALTFFLFYTM